MVVAVIEWMAKCLLLLDVVDPALVLITLKLDRDPVLILIVEGGRRANHVGGLNWRVWVVPRRILLV